MNNLFDLLKEKNATCIIMHKGDIIFTSIKKGVAPMLDFYDQYLGNHSDLVVIDSIMGRGAVLLAKLIGAVSIHTPIISKPALELARDYKMHIEYLDIVPKILNRSKDGQCPIEKSVLKISDTKKGYEIIKNTLKMLAQTM